MQYRNVAERSQPGPEARPGTLRDLWAPTLPSKGPGKAQRLQRPKALSGRSGRAGGCLRLRGGGSATALVLFSISKFTPVGSAGAHQFKVQVKCHDCVLTHLFCVR